MDIFPEYIQSTEYENIYNSIQYYQLLSYLVYSKSYYMGILLVIYLDAQLKKKLYARFHTEKG